MPRYDIARLRKEKGMSQSELASRLQITQSFLSAIENGKSPLPIEKEDMLCEIFNISDLNSLIIKPCKAAEQASNLTEMTDSDLFNQLLNRFHKHAHSEESEHHHHDHHQKIKDLEQKLDSMLDRIDSLLQRNDNLSADNDRLRAQIDNYRLEIDRLRKENHELLNRPN